MRYLRTLYIERSLVRRRVTRRLTRLQTMYNVLKFSKNDEIMSKNQFTGTATQSQRNRKFCQFNKDQYCTYEPRLYPKQSTVRKLHVTCLYFVVFRLLIYSNLLFSRVREIFSKSASSPPRIILHNLVRKKFEVKHYSLTCLYKVSHPQ